jgi:large subunit ribosomal protein L32e
MTATKEEIIEQISTIKGLGKAKAELLYANGFNSIDKIKESKIEKLTQIKGINEKIAKDIKKQANDIIKNNRDIKPKKDIQEKKKSKKDIDTPKKGNDKEKQTQKDIDTKEEEKLYIVKKKPKLTNDQKNNLQIRKQIKKRTPKFLREEWYRYKRIPKNWRRPDGITSKMRINLKYRPNKVRVGYRGPKQIRGLHSSGFEEILIHNKNELHNIDNTKQAIRIGSTVGTKKRIEIEKEAENLDIRILNIGGRKND